MRRKTKQKHNTICVGHHYAQTNTNNVNKKRPLLQAIRRNRNGNHNTELRTHRHIIEQHRNRNVHHNTELRTYRHIIEQHRYRNGHHNTNSERTDT